MAIARDDGVRVTCIGGGPAGLYFAIFAKRRFPAWRIRVLERNRPLDTFGWGVVFSDATLENLRAADEPTHRAITASFAHWDDIDVHFEGIRSRSGGHGFCGIARKRLLQILQRTRGRSRRRDRVRDRRDRRASAARACDIARRCRRAEQPRPCGLRRRLRPEHRRAALPVRLAGDDAAAGRLHLHLRARPSTAGSPSHAYRFDEELSTFIVECREETWLAHGLDTAGTEETIAFCEKLFEPYLHGHRLMANSRAPARPRVAELPARRATTWVHENVVLMGDAAHTAHFSVGLGDEAGDGRCDRLADALRRHATGCPRRFERYQAERGVEVLEMQNAARNSTEWFENVARYAGLAPEQFAYSLLTRSQRIGHENLRLRDTTYVERVERWFAGGAAVAAHVHADPFAQSRIAQPRCRFSHGYVQRGRRYAQRLSSRAPGQPRAGRRRPARSRR